MHTHFGSRFRALHWCTDQIMNDALAQMELTASQGRILGYIAHQSQPPCPKDIEEHFHLSHPSVSGTLSRMEKKGFIRFGEDDRDRRCKRIHMLKKGRECCERMSRRIAQIEMQVVADFTPEEQALFSQLLDRAIGNLGAESCKSFHKEETQC